MAKKLVKYSMVDAFTDTAFKGNPAAVCFLEEEKDEKWLQSLAAEFNLSETCYLTRVIHDSADELPKIPRFRLRWFSPMVEVDAFTDTAFKGNPAAVCFLEEEKDEKWLQSLAAEFNLSETCYLTRVIHDSADELPKIPRFRLRWFTPMVEVELCGHATLAASHFLFSHVLEDGDAVEFSTLSGILSARRVPECDSANMDKGFFIELNFPVVQVMDLEFDSGETSILSKSLGGVSVIDIKKTTIGDLLVVLPSAKAVSEVQPNFGEMLKFPGNGIIITGQAPPESGCDFFSRYFAPKIGINEDPVTGSVHCALATYWCSKLAKCDFVAHQASRRSGMIKLHLDEKNQRVLLQGKAITVMEGSILI